MLDNYSETSPDRQYVAGTYDFDWVWEAAKALKDILENRAQWPASKILEDSDVSKLEELKGWVQFERGQVDVFAPKIRADPVLMTDEIEEKLNETSDNFDSLDSIIDDRLRDHEDAKSAQ